MSIMLMLALGSLAARAQDNGATTNNSSTTTTSPAPSTSTTTTSDAPSSTHSSSSESMQGLSTNTWILIAIGGIAFLVLIVVLVRSRTVSETTIVK